MKNFEEIMSERKNRIEARKDELIRRSLLSEEFLEMIEYSNAIVHAFQGFRAPFSGKIVHIFPEQSAAFN